MKNIVFFQIIFLLICLSGTSGQNKISSLPCDDFMNYSPILEAYTPIKTVQIVIHIFQRSDSVGSFVESETSRYWIRNKIINHLNGVLGNLERMRLKSNSVYIQDSRIRFKLDTILFHTDDTGWDMKCLKHFTPECKITENLGDSLYWKYVTNNFNVINKNNSIHIFCGENQTGKGMASGIGDKRWVMVTGFYYYYKSENFWMPANLLRHELGHSLGLMHTWDSEDFCDDTPENNGCWNGPECSNNVMDYNADQASLTECQLARIHFYLSGKAGNIKEAVIKDYCKHDGSVNEIEEGDLIEWNSEKYFKGDIHIFNQATLIIKCKIALPEGAKVIIDKGGKLIIDGGLITNDCGQKWKGLKINGNRKERKDPEKYGLFEIKNGGKMENIQ